MQFKDNRRFWVVFDTCTRSSYYQDLHNLLALPRGATLRYEYRERYLSPSAIEAARNPESAPAQVLLVYAQRAGHHRGDPVPEPSTDAGQIIWVGTRLGEMLLIPSQEGENFFFDFKVLEYPRLDEPTLRRILQPLIARNEVPFIKWVSLAEEVQALSPLKGASEEENWQSIVNTLGTTTQFAGDSFWRVKGPFVGRRGHVVRAKYDKELQVVANRSEVRKVSSLYDLSEGDVCSLEAVSHTPAGYGPHRGPRTLNVRVDPAGPLAVLGDAALDLRQYTGHIVKVKAKRYAEVEDHHGTVSLDSPLDQSGWPTGPRITLAFSVAKKVWEVIVGLVALVAAGVLGLFAVKFWDGAPDRAILLGLIGVVCAILASLLLTGRLGLKP